MILALDAGNSRIKWGYFADGRWLKTGAISRTEIETLPSVLRETPRPQKIVVSNVAGTEIREKITNAIAQFGTDAYWPKPVKECCGVRNGYDKPEQLGSDRWAALIGARRTQPGAVLVVNAGTALTIDALTDAGEFLGGVILPGIGMMMRALTTGTAHAHAAYGDFVTFPTTTTNAIYSGALNAALGAIERMRVAFTNRSATPPSCLITGGAASVLLPHLAPPAQETSNLVMLGLVTMMEAKA